MTQIEKKTRLKPMICTIMAVIGGTFYFAVPVAGGEKLEPILSIGDETSKLLLGLSIGSTAVYTLFTYKLLDGMSFWLNTPYKCIFLPLAPLSALANFNAGYQGALVLGLPVSAAIAVGLVNYTFRVVNYVDASGKIPERFMEVINTGKEAWGTKKWGEFLRFIFAGIVTLGYIMASTDSHYTSLYMFSVLFKMNPKAIYAFCMTFSIIAAIGMIPSVFYWTHRGLSELTFGRQAQIETDRYSWFAVVFAAPSMIGSLGIISSQSKFVFAQLGMFSTFVGVISSLFYGAFSSIPGIAGFLRGLISMLYESCFSHSSPVRKLESIPNVATLEENDSIPMRLVSPGSLSLFHNNTETVIYNRHSLGSLDAC